MTAAAIPADLVMPDSAFVRLWQGLMTARVMIAFALLLLLGSMYQLNSIGKPWLLLLCLAYLLQTLLLRLLARPRPAGTADDTQWLWTIGVDLLVFSVLQYAQEATINYTPLFAVPVLVAAVMGSRLLALGTASGVALLLLLKAYLDYQLAQLGAASLFFQAGLTGTACLILAVLINQLASRLAGEERRAHRSQTAAMLQTRLNELVIEFLEEGVLVVDHEGGLRAVNPAARRLLGWPEAVAILPDLAKDESGRPLLHVAQQTFETSAPQLADITVLQDRPGQRPIHARTRLTGGGHLQAERLCVVFLQDRREMEAKIRTEKLAAMGRMSAAVAHEIRNPLAAISQANALLEEDLKNPAHRRLTAMVQQNARRLSQIVEEVLDISRVQRRLAPGAGPSISLNQSTRRACNEWARQTANSSRLLLDLDAAANEASFDAAHLQRLLVNLLDNASRYAGQKADSIQVSTNGGTELGASLRVWSDGKPIAPGVQSHLFEPFFSSESRSTGLGLYICRELCERHGAVISYQRARRNLDLGPIEGNEFLIRFRPQKLVDSTRQATPIIAS